MPSHAKNLFKVPQFSKEILWSTFVQIAGKCLQIGLGVLSVKLMTQTLGPDQYGTYGKISEFSLFFATAANLGIFGNTVRQMAEKPHDGLLFANAIFLRATTALSFFGVGWIYASVFIKDPIFLAGTFFFMGSLFFDYLVSVCDGLLQAHYKMGRATLATLLGRFVNLSVLLLLTHQFVQEAPASPESVPLFFLAPLCSSLVTLGLTSLFSRQVLKPVWKVQKDLMKGLLWASLPFGIINLINSLYFRFLPSAFLTKILPENQFGTYTLSLHIATMVSLLSTVFMFSVLPKLEQHLKAKNWKEASLLYTSARSLLVVSAVLIIGFGTWLAPLGLVLLSKKEFLDPNYWFVLPLLLVLAAVSYFYDLAFLTLFALKQETKWLKQEGVALCLSLGISSLAFLAPHTAPIQTFLILTGAIAAEASMALWGMRRIKERFKEQD